MLKKFNLKNSCDYGFLLIGEAKEISRTYRKMCEKSVEFRPLFLDEPKYNPKRIYGIKVSKTEGNFQIINEDLVVCYVLNELEKELERKKEVKEL